MELPTGPKITIWKQESGSSITSLLSGPVGSSMGWVVGPCALDQAHRTLRPYLNVQGWAQAVWGTVTQSWCAWLLRDPRVKSRHTKTIWCLRAWWRWHRAPRSIPACRGPGRICTGPQGQICLGGQLRLHWAEPKSDLRAQSGLQTRQHFSSGPQGKRSSTVLEYTETWSILKGKSS